MAVDQALVASSPLIGEEEIRKRVAELGQQITQDYHGREPLLVGVLKGAMVFLVDLARSIRLPLELDFMAVASYGTMARSTGAVRITKDLDEPLEGRDVLLVEDVVDTGLTLRYVMRALRARRPRSLRVCALLVKEKARPYPVHIDYVGFTIPDVFVVGYGLDYKEAGRNLPYLVVHPGAGDSP